MKSTKKNLAVLCLFVGIFAASCGGNGKNEIPKDTTGTQNQMTQVLAPLDDLKSISTGDASIQVNEWMTLDYSADQESLYDIETVQKEASRLLVVNSKIILPILHEHKWYNKMTLDLENFFPESKPSKKGKKPAAKFPAFVRKRSIEQMELLVQNIVDCMNAAQAHESSHHPTPDIKEAKQGNVVCDGKQAANLFDILKKASVRDRQVAPEMQVLQDFKKHSASTSKIVVGESVLLEKLNLIGIVCEKKEKNCVLASISNEQ